MGVVATAACSGDAGGVGAADPDGSLPIEVDPPADAGAVFDVADVGAERDTGAPFVPPDTTDDRLFPPPTSIGPCSKEYYAGGGDEPHFTYAYDYSEYPERVGILRSEGVVLDVRFDVVGLTSRESCRVPPHELHMTGVEIIGCPLRVESDIGGDGQNTRLDFAVNYLYDGNGSLVNGDKFDWRDDYAFTRWIYDWDRSGRIVEARREDNSSIGARVTYRYDIDRWQLIVERDDGDNGEVDEVARYVYGSDGDLREVAVQRRDPGTREMRDHSRSVYHYDCWH